MTRCAELQDLQALIKIFWLTVLGGLLVVFETLLSLRTHYTMDVFTGFVTGLYAAPLADLISTTLSDSKIPIEL
jgi:hypothetical protein